MIKIIQGIHYYVRMRKCLPVKFDVIIVLIRSIERTSVTSKNNSRFEISVNGTSRKIYHGINSLFFYVKTSSESVCVSLFRGNIRRG